MKCPLLCAGKLAVGEITQDTLSDCLKGECAWWDDSLKLCSVRVIGQFMVGIGVNIHNIAENMPFKAQL